MGQILHKYPKVDQLPPNAVPVALYAERNGTNRSYIHVKYDRWKNGFEKNGNTYYGAKPAYSIVKYHTACYVIPDEE